jgi:hypothetical protein
MFVRENPLLFPTEDYLPQMLSVLKPIPSPFLNRMVLSSELVEPVMSFENQ